MHQAASRYLRRDIVQAMRKYVKELDGVVEVDELADAVEAHANEVEKNFVKIISSEEHNNQYEELRRRFLGSPTPVPCFDFEMNWTISFSISQTYKN